MKKRAAATASTASSEAKKLEARKNKPKPKAEVVEIVKSEVIEVVDALPPGETEQPEVVDASPSVSSRRGSTSSLVARPTKAVSKTVRKEKRNSKAGVIDSMFGGLMKTKYVFSFPKDSGR